MNATSMPALNRRTQRLTHAGFPDPRAYSGSREPLLLWQWTQHLPIAGARGCARGSRIAHCVARVGSLIPDEDVAGNYWPGGGEDQVNEPRPAARLLARGGLPALAPAGIRAFGCRRCIYPRGAGRLLNPVLIAALRRAWLSLPVRAPDPDLDTATSPDGLVASYFRSMNTWPCTFQHVLAAFAFQHPLAIPANGCWKRQGPPVGGPLSFWLGD